MSATCILIVSSHESRQLSLLAAKLAAISVDVLPDSVGEDINRAKDLLNAIANRSTSPISAELFDAIDAVTSSSMDEEMSDFREAACDGDLSARPGHEEELDDICEQIASAYRISNELDARIVKAVMPTRRYVELAIIRQSLHYNAPDDALSLAAKGDVPDAGLQP